MSATSRQATPAPVVADRSNGSQSSDVAEILALREEAAAITRRIDRLMALLRADPPERPAGA